MGDAGKYDNKHGVGILLNKKWKQRILTLKTSTNVPSPPQSSATANASNWWVYRYTVSEGNKKVTGWNIGWLMLQGYTALNTMYRKTPQRRRTFISPRKNKLTTFWPRKCLRHTKMPRPATWSTWEVSTDMLWLFLRSPLPGKNINIKKTKKQDTIEYDERDQAEKIEAVKAWAQKKRILLRK